MKHLLILILTIGSAQAQLFGGADPLDKLNDFYKDAGDESHLREDIRGNEEAMEQHRRSLTEFRRSRERLEAQLVRLEENRQRLEQEGGGSEARIAELQRERDLLALRRAELMQQFREEGVERTQRDLEANRSEATARVTQIDTELEEKRAQLVLEQQARAANEAAGNSGLMTKAMDNSNRLIRQIASLSEERVQRERDIAQSQLGLQNLEVTGANGVTLTEGQQRAVGRITRQMRENQEEVNGIRGDVASAGETRQANQQELQSIRGEIATVTQSLEQSSAQLLAVQSSDQQLRSQFALQRAGVAINRMLTDSDKADLKAEFLFRSLEDITASFEDGLVSESQVLDLIKRDIVAELDKTPVGVYVQEKISAALGGQGGGNLCQSVAMCSGIGEILANVTQGDARQPGADPLANSEEAREPAEAQDAATE